VYFEFIYTFVWNICHSRKVWARYHQQRVTVFMYGTGYSCQILMETSIFWADFQKNIQYQISWTPVQWEPSCSMRTDGQRYDKVISCFRRFVNALKKYCLLHQTTLSFQGRDISNKKIIITWGKIILQYIPIYIQQDTTLHSLFYLKTALHVSGGTSTHHQERKQLYLQHLVFVTPLLLPVAIVEELGLVWVCCGWRILKYYYDINKLYNVVSCWIYIRILLWCK